MRLKDQGGFAVQCSLPQHLKGAASVTTPLDRGGVQTTLHKVVEACGLKKRSRHTACATAMQPT